MLAALVIRKCDRHKRNGELTVNEMQSYMGNHPFVTWLTRKSSNLLK